MTSKKSEAAELLEIRLKYLFESGIDLDARRITLTGEIDTDMFYFVDAALSELERRNNQAVTIRIHSGGGSVYDALAIVGRLTGSKCNIVTEGYGSIMSAATLVLACGWKRRISRFSWYMHHESAYEVEGRHSQIKSVVRQEDREHELWCQWMEEFSEKNRSFWKKSGNHVDAYYSPTELLEMGVIDEIF